MNSVHEQIRAALMKSPKGLTGRQLHAQCDEAGTLSELVQDVHTLKGQGKLVADGMRDSQVVYKLSSWPENAAAPKQEHEKQAVDRAYAGPEKPKRTAAGLREGLFEMLEQLKAGKIDVQTAKTYAALSMTIIKSVEVQLEYERMRIANEVPAHLSDMALVPALEHKPNG